MMLESFKTKSSIMEEEPLSEPLLEGGFYRGDHGAREVAPNHHPYRLYPPVKYHVSCLLYQLVCSLALMILMVLMFPGVLVYLIRTLSFFPEVVPTKAYPLPSSIRWNTFPGDDNYWSESLYMGQPTLESDRAWHKLLAHGGVRVDDHEAQQLNITTSLPLVNGGYGALLGIDHNLHCLRHFRQWYYYDYYYANKTSEEVSWLGEHTGHCLESLRKSLMCNPDLSMLPHYANLNNKFHPINAGSWNVRECVDWDAFQEAVATRRYDVSEYGEEIERLMYEASHRHSS
ncbi:hypothetical protein EJ05DRAFT_220965 [Pseudovirgaria hyperparasitica]|uniref:Tat pathway signal sequence n=1 Tax=Pseudovirgaria hyperparasitica TaxID=470096 RepID=A0A6A6VV82_9PEZI|nr:uncharacterized protein EJ05DRAFT_220965 [Pseudovirgaria hyperparasitica]KAF2753530.1 hypothetical protein EJ05DRAFT_220965 [Pseudovirgaria hyperparasitica]